MVYQYLSSQKMNQEKEKENLSILANVTQKLARLCEIYQQQNVTTSLSVTYKWYNNTKQTVKHALKYYSTSS